MHVPQPRLAVVAAVTRDAGLGHAGRLPWHPRRLALDMAFFTLLTTHAYSLPPAGPPCLHDAGPGPHVIMGRRTWDSLPPGQRPLRGRRSIVVSGRADGPDGAPRAPSFQAAVDLAAASGSDGPVYVLGGARVYEDALAHPALEAIFLTELTAHPALPADVLFPTAALPAGWEKTNITGHALALLHARGLVKDDPTHYLSRDGTYVDGDIQYRIFLYRPAQGGSAQLPGEKGEADDRPTDR